MLDALITLDFETFFSAEYSLRGSTNESYVRDPRFEVIGVGVKLGKRPTVWLEEYEFREWTARVDWARCAVNCHHAQFDAAILSWRYGIKPGLLLCTMSMARVLGNPRVGLEILGPKYGLGEKGKELHNAKNKHRADFSQAEYAAFGAYCIQDCELTAGLLSKLRVGFPELEFKLIDLTCRMFTEPVLEADQAILTQAGDEEREKKTRLMDRIGATRESLGSSDQFAALLEATGIEPPLKESPRAKNDDGTPKQIFAFAKSDPAMQALLEHERDEVRFLAEARLSVRSTLIETRTERLAGIGQRGTVPIYLKYGGAHTHRWSGGDKMNPQNFNRGGALRDALIAPDGHVLCVADSGQIEARVVAWLARQTELLETFRRNDLKGKDGDFYSDEGSRYFRRKLSKETTPVERQVSKSMVLGLGFGMGWFKFASELLRGMLGAAPVQFGAREVEIFKVDVARFVSEVKHMDRAGKTAYQRIEELPVRIPLEDRLIHCAVTHFFVELYRATNPKISKTWSAFGDLLSVMVRPGASQVWGPLTFKHEGIQMPAGLTLHYPGLRKAKGGYVYMGGKGGREWTKVYGGLLVENVVQKLARDIVGEQAIRIAERGYKIATTTHDEILCCVPTSQGPECMAFMLDTMKTAPAWCSDLPLNASGGTAVRYGEAK